MSTKKFLTLIVTIIGSGIVILDGTVVNLALPALNRDLNTSFNGLQWVIDAYLLTLSSLILLGGSLGDIFGRKKMYIIGLAGFGVFSAACGFAQDSTVLIVLRSLQGVFGALLVPGGLAIINTNFSPAERGLAIGRWGAWSGIASAVGPLVGGYIIDAFSWHWIFFMNVPLVIICLAIAIPNIKETKDHASRHVDVPGSMLAMAFLACLSFGLIEGPVQHWNFITIAALVLSVVFFAAFILVERRSPDPMMSFDLFKSRNFDGANIMTFAMYGAMAGMFFSLVIYLQSTLHYSAVVAGASLLPVTVLLLVLSGRMGKLTNTVGPRLFLTAGPLISAAGMLWLLPLNENSSYLFGVMPGVILFGLGLGIFVAPLTVTVMGSEKDSDSGIASGINNAVARAAGVVVVAVLGLFGAANVYQFSILLSAGLAVTAGLVSFVFIRNHKRRVARG